MTVIAGLTRNPHRQRMVAVATTAHGWRLLSDT